MATAVSTVAAAKMNLRPVNHSALRRYQQFWNSLVRLEAALGDMERLIARAGDSKAKHSYRVPDATELNRVLKQVKGALQLMINESRKWEAELVSREWR
jgi:hypothetical protein